jgi:DNA processing protein
MDTRIRELGPEEFPPLLREIHDAPKKLYVRGSLPSFDLFHIAVVGSRKYTNYGKAACEHIIEGLRGYPVVIISGLALGMDAIAHRAALSAGLTTIAVPGSGISDRAIRPATNFALAREILQKGGALLSEYEPDFEATQWSFPRRNRIMAGLSHATLIIEAAEKSGTLITARLAMESNREVLAVPGSVFSENSYGPHDLIKNGAAPVTSARDILHILGIPEREDTEEMEGATPEETAILSLLSEPRDRDEIARESGMETRALSALLSLMELEGKIASDDGKFRRT